MLSLQQFTGMADNHKCTKLEQMFPQHLNRQQQCTIGCSEFQDFHVKKSSTRHASSWGLNRKDPKGFLILTMFKGSSGHLKFEKIDTAVESISFQIYFYRTQVSWGPIYVSQSLSVCLSLREVLLT